MHRYRNAACVCAALMASGIVSQAFAEDVSTGEKPDGWEGQIEASAASSTGNTESTNLGLKAHFQRKIGRFVHDFTAKVDYAEQTQMVDGKEVEKTTQDKWLTAYQVDAQLRDRTHGYARVQYDEDRFAGFAKRWFVGVGLGHDIFDSDGLTWSVEAGPGYRWAELERSPTTGQMPPRARTHELAAYADSDIDVQINENVKLEQNSNVTYAQTNTTYDNVVGLSTKLTETLSSKVSYQVKYETDPPDGRKNKDTMLKASLLLGF